MTEERKRELAESARDRALKNAKREWAAAKNASNDVEAGPHYGIAKRHYARVKYYDEKLKQMK
ncbi:MAG: hypothetical protein IJT06_00260 [Selenomonadaceae bacterium]|nr:hypothetical protein [Selenomonadaceae bacterium]